VSGPLASWVEAHSTASPTARFVLVTLALRADADGTGADHSIEQLHELTGYHDATVKRALAELRKEREDGSKELELVRAGGGRERISRHRIPIRWCADDAGCVTCKALAKAIAAQKAAQSAPVSRGGDTRETGAQRARSAGKRAHAARKLTRSAQKGAHSAPPYEDGDGSPTTGGTVTHPESAAALAPDGAAAEPGQQEQAGSGEPAPIPAEVWAIVHGGQPRPRRSTAEERAAEEQDKRARALRLVAEHGWQSGQSITERSSA
jgi:hypothetical protein